MKKLVFLLLLFLCGCMPVQQQEQQAEQKTEFVPKEWNFHYAQLDEEMKSLYETMYTGICSFESKIVLSDATEEQLLTTFRCILEDHPELFYVNTQYHYELYADHSVAFYPTYDYDEKTYKERLATIDEQCTDILDQISSQADEEEVAAYIYRYLIEHTAYQKNEHDQQMDSVFLQGESVCAGYAKAYQYLMQKAGIPCTTISGEWIDEGETSLDTSEGHAWNLISLQDDWFYVDVTSGDIVDYGPHTCYQFFKLSTQEASMMYAPTDLVPQTKDPTQSYFQSRHLYLESYDEQVLQLAIDEMKRQGDGVLELRTEAYGSERLKAELLKDNRIFQLLAQNGIYVDTLGYAAIEALGSLEFYYEPIA